MQPIRINSIAGSNMMVKTMGNGKTLAVQDTVTIPKSEYFKLKRQAEIDVDLLKQFLESFKDIKEGRIRRVK
ncbi:MAG: hypothetical protein PHP62_05750 [Candidatus Moranbacteria bacterium]|nr:hypothetical protein [Candidatus Moranbacteria bacterium]